MCRSSPSPSAVPCHPLFPPPSDIGFARVHLKPKLEKLQFDTLYYSPTLELFLVPLLQVDRW